jgi:hypothetical protein
VSRRVPALLLAALTFGAGPVAGQRAGAPAGPPGSELTVYLMTMGPGRLVWERFGHNAIWIHDPAAPPDQAYNYGLFDFQQQNFLLRFIQGQMWYWMDGFPAESYVRAYRRANRSVYLQELNLPPAARLELQRFLRWNQLPANRFYHYDYYRDNCSTRVRDALDRVLGGTIRAQTSSVPAGKTYRFHTQRLTANDPLIFTGLLLALGQGVDRPLSRWDEMFLPMEMREHLRSVTVPGADGRPAPLVLSERTLLESSATSPPAVPPRWLARYLFLGVILGCAAAWLGGVARRESSGRVAFGLVVGGWELLAGTGGVVLAGLWSFTDHVMAYRNENLLQINPLALALTLALPFALRGSSRVGRVAQALAVVIAGCSLLGLVLKVLPGFDQANVQVIALALPAHLGVAAGIRRSR